MKKYFLLSAISLFALTTVVSCVERVDEVQQIQDNDTYSVAYDIKNVNFSYNSTDGYFISRTFNSPLYNTDVVLIYRQNGTSNGNPVWQQIPRTLYLSQGELDYDFDFTKNDVMIYAGGTFDISTVPQYINNQTFRVVIVPASGGKNANVDYSDYNSVIKFYKIDEAKIKSL